MEIYGMFKEIIDPESFSRPLFLPHEKILAVDVDGVLLEQVSTQRNGRRGKDTYKVNKKASKIVQRSRKDRVDRIVLWTQSPESLSKLINKEKSFAGADLLIVGADYSTGRPLKPLRILTSELRNVIGIENDDFFTPRGQVIYVKSKPKDSVMKRYYQALDLLHGRA